MIAKIKKIFNEAQDRIGNHQYLSEDLKDMFAKPANKGDFWQPFFTLLNKVILDAHNAPCIERCISFSAFFLSKLVCIEEDSLYLDQGAYQFFHYLLSHIESSKAVIRYRICQIINACLKKFEQNNIDIDSDLFDLFILKLSERSEDINYKVRMHATESLMVFQSPDDLECPIIDKLSLLMSHDPKHEVRLTITKTICVNNKTLPLLVERIFDPYEAIRYIAFKRIGQIVKLKYVMITDRIKILEGLINDPCSSIQEKGYDLVIVNWLQELDNDVIVFLSKLAIFEHEDLCSQFLHVYFNKNSFEECIYFCKKYSSAAFLPNFKSEIISEYLFYWKNFLAFIKKEDPTQLEAILPDTLTFCNLIQEWFHTHSLLYYTPTFLSREVVERYFYEKFQLSYVISICKFIDVSDIFLGKKMKNILIEILIDFQSNDSKVVYELLLALKRFEKHLRPWIELIKDCISEILAPLLGEQRQRVYGERINMIDEKLKESAEDDETRLCLERQRDKINRSLQCHDQLTNENMDSEDRDNNTDRGLFILSELLNALPPCYSAKYCSSFMPSLVLPSIASMNPSTRKHAFKCLLLLCLDNKDEVISKLPLVLKAVKIGSSEIRVLCLKGICDFLVLYDLAELGENDFKDYLAEDETIFSLCALNEDDVVSLSNSEYQQDLILRSSEMAEDSVNLVFKLIYFVRNFLYFEDGSELQNVAIDGFIRLFLTNKINSPSVMSELFLLYLNPENIKNSEIMSKLSGFFFNFASLSQRNKEEIVNAFIPTLLPILKASCKTNFHRISVKYVLKVFINLINSKTISSKHSANEEEEPQALKDLNDKLAIAILDHLYENRSESYCCSLSTLLSYLNISEEGARQIHKEYADKVKDCLEFIASKKSQFYINSFLEKLSLSSQSIKDSQSSTIPSSQITISQFSSQKENSTP